MVVTGVSPNSIGEGISIAIAAHQPNTLILVSRSQSKLDEVATGIQKVYPKVAVKTVIVDLLSQKSIKQAAETINGLTDSIHVLINNAGAMYQKKVTSEEGIEGQFAANHIGPFLLSNLLVNKLRAAAKDSVPGSVRIINTSSMGHRLSPVRFHDYNMEGKEIPGEEKSTIPLSGTFAKEIDGYNGFVAYGQSKSASILFSVELTERLRNDGILSFALHPGSKKQPPLYFVSISIDFAQVSGPICREIWTRRAMKQLERPLPSGRTLIKVQPRHAWQLLTQLWTVRQRPNFPRASRCLLTIFL